MISGAILVLAYLGAEPVKWFGPTRATFHFATSGNPYDPVVNDAWMTFTGHGEEFKTPAYFEDGTWRASFVAHQPGKYMAVLSVNGRDHMQETVLVNNPMPDGYVRADGANFKLDSGARYWPMGHDLGWQSGEGFPDLTDFLATMGQNGVDWTRIWACSWDGKNPWWPNDGTKLPIGELWPKAIHRWDAIIAAAEKAHIRFQFVLFHHGEFSSTTDSNWKDNPWNAANGGFLQKPDDFFTDPKAKALAKEWIRYAVARWGTSPAIMGWELFNEVQWTDGARNHPAEVGAWHDEMADYVRSLDPVHHLVLTSSELSLPIWSKMDYLSPHGYPARIEAMVMAQALPKDKPLFFGEVGPGDFGGDKRTQTLAVRDGIWSGLLALQSGAAEYWTWDQIPKNNLLNEYKISRKILNESAVLDEAGLSRIEVGLDSGIGADLSLAPGGSWEPFRQFDYHLPADAAAMGKFSTFFQGKGHPEMRPQPVRFFFESPQEGKLTIRVTGISDTGGELTVKVNGSVAAHKSWPGRAKLPNGEVLEATIPAGSDTVELTNDGSDWIQIGRITIPGIAPNATALAIGSPKLLVMRIERPDGATRSSLQLSGLPFENGLAAGVLTDLDTGIATKVNLTIEGGRSSTRLEAPFKDAVLWLRRVEIR